MGAKKTNIEFINQINDLTGDEYKFLTIYKAYHEKINVIHTICGHEYSVSPANFIGGKRCPKCAGNIKKNDEEFKEEVYNLVGNEYEFLEEYKTTKEKLKCKHNQCGDIYYIMPSNFLRGDRCPKCAGNKKKTEKEFKEEVYNLVGNEYEFLEKYVNSQEKLLCKHNQCGYIYSVRPNDFLQGNRCPRCAGNLMKNDDEFKEEVTRLVGVKYEFLDKYKGGSHKISVIHKECGNIYGVEPERFLRGDRCPRCKQSKGERIIYDLLNEFGINFEPQCKFNDCKNINPLPFDFITIDSESKRIFAIEYDGEQHYEVVKGWGGKEKFKKTQKNDKIKNEYCFNNNIPLLRIPYWESENIEHILFDFLVEHGALEEITV